MLKIASLVDYPLMFYNRLYDTGTFPSEWSKSIIAPTPEKGHTSVGSKVCTYILNRNYILIRGGRAGGENNRRSRI